MATVTVRTATIELKTVNVSKSLLKQMRVIYNFNDVRPYLPGGHEAQTVPPPVLGWVHGSVFEPGDAWGRWLLIRTGPGDYARYKTTDDMANKFQQIYVP